VLNMHPRDSRLEFFAGDHVYLIDGERSLGSVTGLIHQFAEEFDAPLAARRMISGRNWPRPGYILPEAPVDVLQAIRRIPGGSEIADAVQAEIRCEQTIAALACRVRGVSQHARCLVDNLAMDVDDIQRKWDLLRDNAALEGTWMHWTFEAPCAFMTK